MTTSASRAYLDHIVSQTRHNIEFLLAQDQISQTDASAILDRLPATWEQSSAAPIAPVPQATPARKVAPAPSSFASPPAYVPPAVTQCRALWAYKGEVRLRSPFSRSSFDLLNTGAQRSRFPSRRYHHSGGGTQRRLVVWYLQRQDGRLPSQLR
jgi:hypothetical protein